MIVISITYIIACKIIKSPRFNLTRTTFYQFLIAFVFPGSLLKFCCLVLITEGILDVIYLVKERITKS